MNFVDKYPLLSYSSPESEQGGVITSAMKAEMFISKDLKGVIKELLW